MKIHYSIVIYNGGGGHAVLSFLGDFLLLGGPESFGSAIETVEIYARMLSRGHPREGLESMAEEFQAHVKTLPLTWFKRNRRLFEIAYHSKLGDGEEMIRWQAKPVISLTVFQEGCREIVAVLELLKQQLKPSDDFDFPAFESFLQRRLEQLPTTVEEAEAVIAELRAQDEREREAKVQSRNAKVRKIAKGGPKKIALNNDDYAARYVGHTKDGRQFFLTTPFVPAVGNEPGREFIALYVFDKAGKLQLATIDDLGPRATMDEAAREARRDELLASLGEVKYRRIKIAPFEVERFGVQFGFIPEPPDDPGQTHHEVMECQGLMENF